MRIKFAKMHGLGNDFMVIDGINQPISLNSEQIISLADRHTGVGFDQLLLIEQSVRDNVDFNYRIFNADGQEVGQCGNGARCLAVFARHYGLTTQNRLTVATKTTQMTLTINDDHTVSVDMGIPDFIPQNIPLRAPIQAPEYPLALENEQVRIRALSVGNPHAVLVVDNIQAAPVATIGQQISIHPDFPEQVNVGFMQMINNQHLKLRVYERGCGETLACGSGAAAAAAIGRLFYHMEPQIKVSLPGGDLLVHWPHPEMSLTLTGPALFVYEGTLF